MYAGPAWPITHVPSRRKVVARVKADEVDMHVEADKRRREWYALYLGFEVRKESVANADGGNFSEDAERIVKRKKRELSLVICTRNLATIEQLYTEDTVLMPPNNDME